MLSTINLTVNGQELTANSTTAASNLIEEITCSFTFSGTHWSGFTDIYALFQNKQNGIVIEIKLTNNACTVPFEVLAKKGEIYVNLCAYTLDSTTQTKDLQMTSYKTKIIDVLQKVNVEGDNTNPTPEVWRVELANEVQARIAADTTLSNRVTTIEGKEASWDAKVGEAPIDGKQYARKDGAWSEVEGGSSAVTSVNGKTGAVVLDADDVGALADDTTLADLPTDTTHRTVTDSEKTTWNAKLSDAPSDSKQYARKNGAWTEVEAGTNVFIATYGTTTASEIATAITAGKAIFCKYTNGGVTHQLMLVDESNSKYGFAETTVGTVSDVTSISGITIALSKDDNTWEVLTGSSSIPTKTSDLTNDGDGTNAFLTQHQSLSAYYNKTETDDLLDDKVDKVTGKGLSEEDFTSTLKTKLDGIEEGAEVNIAYAIDPYAGADLTVKFADEIANFSDEWAWIKNRKTTGNFEGLHTHDYIPVTCENASAYVLKMEIAGINTYKGTGASEIGNHIDFISKDCWPDTVQYNPVNYNNGICLDKFTADGSATAFQLTHRTASTFPSGLSAVKVNGTAVDASTYSYDSSTGVLTFTTAPASGAVIKAVWATADQNKMPFLASGLSAFLMSDKRGVPNEAAADPTLTEVDFTNGGIWNYLPTKVKNVIIDKMGYPGTRLTEGTLRTSENTWDSANQGKLWLPCEMEVYGEHIWSTTYESAFGRQYPCFMNGNRKKGAGNGGSRSGWWLSSPYSGSSTFFCIVNYFGAASSHTASLSIRVPVCFRI